MLAGGNLPLRMTRVKRLIRYGTSMMKQTCKRWLGIGTLLAAVGLGFTSDSMAQRSSKIPADVKI